MNSFINYCKNGDLLKCIETIKNILILIYILMMNVFFVFHVKMAIYMLLNG